MTPLAVLSLLSGCSSVLSQYEAARLDALARPGAAPADFAPDAQVLLSGALVDDLVGDAVVGLPVEGRADLGVLSVQPKLVVRRFEVQPGAAEDTLSVDLRLDGDLAATSLLGTSTTPIRLDASVEARLTVSPAEGGATRVTAQPVSVSRLALELPGLPEQGVAAWVRRSLVDLLPPIVLAELPAESLPVTGMRVQPAGDGVRIDLRTAAPHAEALSELASPPEHGFRVRISSSSLVQLGRARAFSEGPLTHGVVAEPTSLDIRPEPGARYGAPVVEGRGGLPFSLGLTLWRPVGRGWWRSYLVTGRVILKKGELRLEPEQVQEEGRSPGATVVDPLAALAEGAIARGIGEALTLTLPADLRGKYGGVDTTIRLEALSAGGGFLQADGAVALER